MYMVMLNVRFGILSCSEYTFFLELTGPQAVRVTNKFVPDHQHGGKNPGGLSLGQALLHFLSLCLRCAREDLISEETMLLRRQPRWGWLRQDEPDVEELMGENPVDATTDATSASSRPAREEQDGEEEEEELPLDSVRLDVSRV